MASPLEVRLHFLWAPEPQRERVVGDRPPVRDERVHDMWECLAIYFTVT